MNIRRLLLRLVLGSRLPATSGRISLPGLDSAVTIRRDQFGIPHIDSETDAGVWFGLGFCEAQDRAFQLELRLRTVRGTLSAAFGPQTLAIDRLARRIGFREAAERQLAVIDDDVRAQVDAFVAGLNAGLTAGARRPAPEFALLRLRPSLWQPADVLGMAKLMSFLLIGNWDVELSRLKILSLDGAQALRDLDPSYPANHPVAADPAATAGPAIERLTQDIEAFLGFAAPPAGSGFGPSPEPFVDTDRAPSGSNAWALAGSRTASGRTLLASDPHLEATLPPHWYLAHLRTPQWSLAGAALIGSPAVGVGHNGFAAWGATAGVSDTVDLFVEELAADGRRVRRGDAFEACQVRREVIEVKGKPSVVEDVLVTSHGPLVGPALDGDPGAVAMRAMWLDARPVRGFADLPRSRSFADFRRGFAAWPLISQNLVYADQAGAIGWQLVGEAPRRRKGWGTLPLPGADPDAGWHPTGVPFAAMPHASDPAPGFLVSANNKPAADSAGAPFLGVDWIDGYRAARIAEALADRSDWDLAATQRLQLDTVSLPWREVRDLILGLPAASEEAAFALGLLRGWDGAVAADSAAAPVFGLFVAEMRRRIARARAPKAYQWAIGRGFTSLVPVSTFTAGRSSHVLRLLRDQPGGWFDRPWREEMADALASVVRDLRSRQGADPQAWSWGRTRPLVLPHPVGRIRQLAPVFNRGPYPWAGDGSTVSPNGGIIASMRMVVEPGDWDGARFSLPGGQSGNPFSPHYDDLLPYWLRGEGVPIAWSPTAIAAATRETLQLQPLR